MLLFAAAITLSNRKPRPRSNLSCSFNNN
jgi:hypothetical protein